MTRIRAGMIGGGRDAFIGAVHRRAMALDGQYDLVAGALSSDPDKALASGRDLGLADARNYASWQEMLERESALPDDHRIQAAVIVTPNHTHFEIARAFAAAGFHIVCDKPLCHTSAQARELIATAKKSGVVFAVTYNYSGYPMVRQARHMVRGGGGELGPLRKVIVEYNQGWLSTALETGGQKQASWRTNPALAGAGAIGDIGSHAEQLLSYITGLELESICADVSTLVPGRRVDDDANMLLHFNGGARGVLIASQIEAGDENDLRIRIYGAEGSLDWRQEEPNQLIHSPISGPERILRRGNAYLCPEARAASRIPPGHPEGFLEAFANIYLGVAAAIRSEPSPPLDFPTVYDGARGVWFIEKALESGLSERKWTDARWSPPP
jgi:predicted dehydrogenase